jgi:hypothetical protein
MEFLCTHFDKTAIDRLELVARTPFKRLTYTGMTHTHTHTHTPSARAAKLDLTSSVSTATCPPFAPAEAIEILLEHVQQGKKTFELAVGKRAGHCRPF